MQFFKVKLQATKLEKAEINYPELKLKKTHFQQLHYKKKYPSSAETTKDFICAIISQNEK